MVSRELRVILNCCILKDVWRMARYLAGEAGKSEITVGYKEFQLYPTGDQASSRCSKGSIGQNSLSKRLRLQYIRYRRLRGPHPVTGRTVKVNVRDYRRREGRLTGEKY